MIGRRLAHYEIIGSIGKGGMGEVYRGRDTKLGRDVAIKVLPSGMSEEAVGDCFAGSAVQPRLSVAVWDAPWG